MMKGITSRFLHIAVIGKLAVAILSLMGFVSVVNAANQKDTAPPPPPQTQVAQKPVEEKDDAPELEFMRESIPFSTVTVKNPTLEKGKTRVRVQGVNGVMTSMFYVAYVDGKEVSRLHISSEVTSEPVNEVVEVGSFTASKPDAPHDDDRGPSDDPKEEEPEPEPDLDPDDDPVVTPPPYCEDVVHRDRTARRTCEYAD